MKELINIELTEQQKDPYNDENDIYFRWLDVQEEDKEDIALANFIESLQMQTDEEIFPKSNWIIVVSYLMKRKFKKIFLEVISNAKFFYINFLFSWNCQRPRFYQTYRGTGQRQIR